MLTEQLSYTMKNIMDSILFRVMYGGGEYIMFHSFRHP